MSICFVSGCKDQVHYICLCKNPATYMCPSHMGTHYMLKCGQVPQSIDAPTSSQESLKRSLLYLAEVKNVIIFNSHNLIQLIKSEAAKLLNIISIEQGKLQSIMSNPENPLLLPDKQRLESRKYFNLLPICEDYLLNSKNCLISMNEGICRHLLLSYKRPVDQVFDWKSLKLTEMTSVSTILACGKCGSSTMSQEMVP